jgi:predicted transcriptional regulator of viral defense system
VAITGGRADRVAAIAGLQRGRLSRDQLRSAGIPDRTISRRAVSGQLRRVHRSVYAVGHTAPAALADETAALLACGPHAVLSHQTAAQLWKLIPHGDAPIHVTIRDRHGPRPTGVTVHRTGRLNRSEVRTVERLPITSALRTLVDLAAKVDLRMLERAVEQALHEKLVSERQLRQAAAAANGTRGASELRALLDQQCEPGLLRSKAERRLRELIRAAGLTVSYVTWTQMEREPFAVVARVAQVLARSQGAG